MSKVPVYIKYIASHYILSVVFLFVFRVVLFLTHTSAHNTKVKEGNELFLISKSFLIGLQFDTVIMGYVLALPLLILTIYSFFRKVDKLLKPITYFIYGLILFSFFISAADIPYFNYNFARLSAVVLESASDSKIIFSMVLEEPSYAVFFLVWFVMFGLYVYLFNKILRVLSYKDNARLPIVQHSLVALLGLGLVFFAIRGRIDSPIRINHSFFCNHSFYNQLGLNPTFVLLKSLKQDQSIKILDDEVALNNVKKQLGITTDLKLNSPLARKVKPAKTRIEKNIVLVILESMTAHKLERFGNTDNLTPFFDSLARISYSFDNVYSAGFHTCNGIFSTLYSYPTVLRERPMSALDMKYFNSLPRVFKELGYENKYFTTGSQTFDNAGAFLSNNDFDKIISQKDYDPKYIQSSFGIPDHKLFDYVIEELDIQKAPFFSAIMTISDHGPYIIPKGIDFKPKHKNIKKQIVEYVDWSLKQFMETAKTKDWYENTVFVFVADHGVVMGEITYEIPFSLHHIPLLIYAPDTSLVKPKVFNNYGTQMDVLPTLSGLLNIEYTNNTFGVDLLKTNRPYSVFSSDDKFGCIDDEFYYIYRKNGKETLHKYKNKTPEDLLDKYTEKAKEMKEYVISIMQTGKRMIRQGKTE